MIKLAYIQTNVFTDEHFEFSGNQLATFYDEQANKELTTEQMLALAREINFSETTFVLEPTTKDCSWKVRIFTPGGELPFAGHPTLGTSFVLRHKQKISQNDPKTTLELNIGPINVTFDKQNIVMTQPKPEFQEEFTKRDVIASILGLSADNIETDYPMQTVTTGVPFLMVPLKKLADVQNITLDSNKLAGIMKSNGFLGLYVFAPETVYQENQLHARMLTSVEELIEDPATGSAAGPAIAYLEKYNVLKNHTRGELIHIEQGYEMNRPSRLVGQILEENTELSGVKVMGKVKLTLEGIYYV